MILHLHLYNRATGCLSTPTAVKCYCSRKTNAMIPKSNETSFIFPHPPQKFWIRTIKWKPEGRSLLKVNQCIFLVVSQVASGESLVTRSQKGLDRSCVGESRIKLVMTRATAWAINTLFLLLSWERRGVREQQHIPVFVPWGEKLYS